MHLLRVPIFAEAAKIVPLFQEALP